MWREAVSLLAEMEAAGVRPTVSCYNAAIMACGKSGMWREALDLLAEMPGKGLARDSGTLSAAISACQKAGRGAKAAALVEEMLEMAKALPGAAGGGGGGESSPLPPGVSAAVSGERDPPVNYFVLHESLLLLSFFSAMFCASECGKTADGFRYAWM